ncbi:MAG: hypothetical protein ACOY46_09775 [Bacillota bacterium]
MFKKAAVSLVLYVCATLISGCGVGETDTKEPLHVVEQYLEVSSNLKWEELDGLLSGEALVDTRKNRGKTISQEKVISKKIALRNVTRNLAEVEADVSKQTSYGFDREAYKFSLQKQGGSWKIYLCEYGSYQHGDLRQGPLPAGVDNIVREYIEMPSEKRKTEDVKYLAGRLLKASSAYGKLPQSQENTSIQVVKNITTLGVSLDYAIVQAEYEIQKEDKSIPAAAIVDLVAVDGKWKIAKLSISKI